MSLSTKAMIVSLKISQWTARKYDRKATGTVEHTYATQGKVGQYSKKLLPGATELAEVQKQATSARLWFYDNTLPWCSDGSRMLKASHYMEFTNQYRKHKTSYDASVAAFIREYPVLQADAKAKLGTLYSDSDYPSAHYLQDAFAIEVSFMPLPDVADFRTEILDSEKNEFMQKMADMEANATRECFNRLHEIVSKAAHKLNDKDGIFRDSLISNIQDMCSMLPKLNINEDPALESMRKQVDSLIATISPDACRSSENIRHEAAQKLDDILANMSPFMKA